MAQLRQTAAALEGLLGRDHFYQTTQTEILAQLKLLEVETWTGLGGLENFGAN
jgi:precorrin-8X/cobalt-precorrin-8 methylmutase